MINIDDKKAQARERARLWRLANPEGWKNYYAANQERLRAKARKRYSEKRSEIIAYAARYRSLHREEILAKMKAKYIPHPLPKQSVEEKRLKNIANVKRWIHKNRERHNAKCRKWQKVHRALYTAKSADYRALKIMAMPSWVDRKSIAEIYLEAKRRSLIENAPYEVDHIWPLQGKGFVGLHVPWNLKVILSTENRKKWNRRPDQVLKND